MGCIRSREEIRRETVLEFLKRTRPKTMARYEEMLKAENTEDITAPKLKINDHVSTDKKVCRPPRSWV